MQSQNRFIARPLAAALVAAGAALMPFAASAQSAVVGSLGNFDAANKEGREAHGFEIQIEGIQPGDLTPSWCGNKYGCPVVVPYATGVYVRYQSPYDAASGQFTATTLAINSGANFAGTCYTWAASYLQAGCDHFGVHLGFTAAASRAVTAAYRWLFADPANPGQLVASSNNIFVPTPVYTIVAPAQPTNPPVLVAEVQTPPPPPAQLYGDATWMKVYKNELNREVALDELTTDNAVETGAVIETEWALVQPSPPPDGRHRQRNKQTNSGNLNAGTRAVLRRYETYAYTGNYDPLTHEALCADGTCTAPAATELGDLLTTQMTAANVAVPSVTISKVGTGSVASSDRILSCGSKCSANYAMNAIVTLTAQAASNSSFTGWSGACSGTSTTCDVTVTDAMNVTANFAAAAGGGGGGAGGGGSGGGGSAGTGGTATSYTLQVNRNSGGVVTATPAGDVALNCGSTCAAKFAPGTAVTLTATANAGKAFVGWSGACIGAAPQCTVTMTGNLSVAPSFR